MPLSLKQHLFKKLSNIDINYTNTFDLCLKILATPHVQSTGESFEKSNNSMKTHQKSKRPKNIFKETRMSRLMKKPGAKFSDCPLSIKCQLSISIHVLQARHIFSHKKRNVTAYILTCCIPTFYFIKFC